MKQAAKFNPTCCLYAIAITIIVHSLFEYILGELGDDPIGYGNDGTKGNAIKHCTWICYIASSPSCSAGDARKFGEAHENYEGNKENHKAMDLHNNDIGAGFGNEGLSALDSLWDCFNKCKKAADDGKLTWIVNENN